MWMPALLLLSFVATLLALWLLAALLIDAWGVAETPEGNYDVIAVPGCAVWDGGHPSPRFRRRIEHAVELWHQGLAPLLLFTGGLGRFSPSEGEAAASLAQSLGVPAEHMVIEDRSTSTQENARHAAPLLRVHRLLLVTDSYHLWRARRVFRRYFEQVDGSAVLAPLRSRLRGALREVPAIVYYGFERRL